MPIRKSIDTLKRRFGAHPGNDAHTAGPSSVDDQGIDTDLRLDDLAPDQGLSASEAAARLERFGPNAIAAARRSVLAEFLSHFWAPIPWMIEGALLLTALTARWADFFIILALLLLNGLVGFWEEHQAAAAIDALREQLATWARVVRDGQLTPVPADQLVPGDLVLLERGDVIPADGRLVTGALDADESVLTGESLPTPKGHGDDLCSGTIVSKGSARLRVLATGPSTRFGRTAELARERGPQSHFQRAIFSIGRYLIVIALVLVALIVLVSLLRGTPVAETLEFALVVTIASIPVALPAVLSVTLAVGARYLAKRQAVVSYLPAIEEMSGVDVLCADKTGTITQNRLVVVEVTPVTGSADGDEVLRDAALTAEGDGRDPVDQAILAALGERGDDRDVVALEPFDADRKRSVADVRDRDGVEYRVAKGAVQAILDLAEDPPGARAEIHRLTSEFAHKGFRALAVARSKDGGWRTTGVLAIEDPPRQDSRETLERARALGVEVKMVTGDRTEIGRQIASEVGIGADIISAEAIGDLEGDAFADFVRDADGFAQVVPEDKYRIVRALQDRGHIVGMTGDGVNDAPALKRADAGIAVSGATDAARASADIVLLAPGLSVIVDAIQSSREVFRRMVNYAIYRITETIRIVLLVAVAIIAFGFFPVTPIQVVLLAILNDAAILTIAFDRVLPSATPERWNLTEVLTVSTVLGVAGVVSSLLFVWMGHGPLGLANAELQTLIYLKLSVAGHLTLFVVRTRGRLWSHRPAGVLVVAVVGTQLIATLIAGFGILMEPIPWTLVLLAWGYALAWMLLLDQVKLVVYHVLARRRDVARAPLEPA